MIARIMKRSKNISQLVKSSHDLVELTDFDAEIFAGGFAGGRELLAHEVTHVATSQKIRIRLKAYDHR